MFGNLDEKYNFHWEEKPVRQLGRKVQSCLINLDFFNP
jgi:hypothetical protein